MPMYARLTFPLGLNPAVAGVYRTAAQDVLVGSKRVNATEHAFASIVKANLDVGNIFLTGWFSRLTESF